MYTLRSSIRIVVYVRVKQFVIIFLHTLTLLYSLIRARACKREYVRGSVGVRAYISSLILTKGIFSKEERYFVVRSPVIKLSRQCDNTISSVLQLAI